VRRALVIVVLLVVAVAACGRDPQRVAPRVPQSPPAEGRCLADELGPLTDRWIDRRDECRSDEATCRRECTSGDADACMSAALVLQNGMPTHSRQISEYFERSCRLGRAMGCTNWAAGKLFEDDTRPFDNCLYRVFQAACDVRDHFGCSMTARILVEWRRTPFDPWIGYGQLMSACDRLGGPPCRFLALYIERGFFGTPDPERVKALLETACSGGDPDACGAQTAAETLK
jgi:hypothetical protein